MIKKVVIFVFVFVFTISFVLSLCGNKICEIDEDRNSCSSDCVCQNINNSNNEIYIDNTGICGLCNDYGPGNITQPYCDFRRAFHKTLFDVNYNSSDKSYVFDNTNDRIDLFEVKVQDAFTFEFEMKKNDSKGINRQVSMFRLRRTTDNNRDENARIMSDSGRFLFIFNLDSFGIISNVSKGIYWLNDGNFHNYVISFNQTELTLFRDGTLFDKQYFSLTPKIKQIDFTSIGYYGETYFPNSSFSKIKIYNATYSQKSISNLVLDMDFSSPISDRSLKGGMQLYIRRGEYHFDYDGLNLFNKNDCTSKFCGATIDNSIFENQTLITGYPFDERPMFLISENAKGWKKFNDRAGANIWYVNWSEIVKNKYPYNSIFLKSIGEEYIPQLVAIHGEVPLLLQQVNSNKNYNAKNDFEKPKSFRNDQFDMDFGDFYYESDKSSNYYGLLFVRLLDESDPNTKEMEIGLEKSLYLFSNWTTISNIKSRYAGTSSKGFWGGNMFFYGYHNTFDNVDISYNDFSSIGGFCEGCTVKNSVFKYNGNSLGGFVGSNNLYLNNLIEYYNYRKFDPGWHAGGLKLIPNMSYNTVHGNIFRNGFSGVALWFDGMLWGHIIENNIFENLTESSGVMVEITNGFSFAPIVIRNNLFLNSGQGSSWNGGIYISASHFVYVLHNTFYNLAGGVVAHGYDNSIDSRKTLTNNKMYNNLFINVTFPMTILTHPSAACSAPGKPYCYSYCPPIGTSQNLQTCTSPTVYDEIYNNSADNNFYFGSTKNKLWEDYINNPNYEIYRSIWINQSKIPIFCDNWCTAQRYYFSDWKNLGYDNHSFYQVNPNVNSIAEEDFRLNSNSLAINSGSEELKNYTSNDFLGVSRDENSLPDIGAYEYFDYAGFKSIMVSLSSPMEGSNQTNNIVLFLCSALSSQEDNVTSISLYHNASGEWKMVEEKKVNSNYSTVEFYDYLENGTYSWNCLAKTRLLREEFAIKNGTFKVNIFPMKAFDPGFNNTVLIEPLVNKSIKDIIGLEEEIDLPVNQTTILNVSNSLDDIENSSSSLNENKTIENAKNSQPYNLLWVVYLLIFLILGAIVFFLVYKYNKSKKADEITLNSFEVLKSVY